MACYHAPTDWEDWSHWLAAGLHGRSRWRLSVLMTGLLFASGRRVVASWIRAAGVSDDYQDYYFFLQSVGRRWTERGRRILVLVLKRAIGRQQRVLVAIDDSPTKRYGPHVQGAGIHHDPTPGPAGAAFCYGHVWVTLAVIVRHPQWGTIGLPIWSWLYVRRQDVSKMSARHGWVFQTKLEQAADLVRRAVETLPPPRVKLCGQRRVGRGRRCLHQTPVRATGDGSGCDACRSLTEGRCAARPATARQARCEEASRSQTSVLRLSASAPNTASTVSHWRSGPPTRKAGRT